jgi:hypothetical protein
LVNGTAAVGVVVAVATVPSGETWIIKEAIAYSAPGTPRAFLAGRRGSLDVPFLDTPLAAAASVRHERWMVLEPGDQIVAYAQSSAFIYWVSGTKLSGVA